MKLRTLSAMRKIAAEFDYGKYTVGKPTSTTQPIAAQKKQVEAERPGLTRNAFIHGFKQGLYGDLVKEFKETWNNQEKRDRIINGIIEAMYQQNGPDGCFN